MKELVATATAVGVLAGGVGILGSAPASAAYAQCKVLGSRIAKTQLTEDKSYYRGLDDWDVYLTGNRTVVYDLKCVGRNKRGKRVRAWIAYTVTESAYGSDDYATDYESAYQEAYEEATEPDWNKYELHYLSVNFKKFGS